MSALAHRCIARCGSDELVLSLSCLTLLYIHILILVLLLPTAYRRRALTVAPTRRTWRRLSSMCTACTPTRLSWQQGFPWEGKAVPLSNSRYKWSSHCLRALDVSSRDAVDLHPTCCHVVERMHEWGNQTEWIMSSSLAMISVIRRRQVLLQGPWSVLSPKACLDVLKLTGLTVQLPLCPPVPRALSARGWACSMASNAEITITCCFSQWQ